MLVVQLLIVVSGVASFCPAVGCIMLGGLAAAGVVVIAAVEEEHPFQLLLFVW